VALRARTVAKTQTVDEKVRALKRTAARNKREFFTLLPQALDDRSPKVRGNAVLLIAKHGYEDAAQLVEPLLYDRSESVRYDAAGSIGVLQRGSKSSPPGLLNLLRDSSALLRVQALENLAVLEDQGALPNVVPLLNDRNPIVRSYAASAIGELGGFAYFGNLLNGLASEKHERARIGFYEALFLLGKRELLPEMLGLLKSPSYQVRCAVANTLESLPLNTPEVRLAISALVDANRQPLAIADKTSIRRVLKGLRDL
jgi:HEAT repeat protein